ncbi:hypothetical protein MTR67_012274 [Solanum verrucosum]|uniref:Tf2-1-like SH3-like domain-containing protein n=1 Tax=Solanum verrucosum TaxID=315347 RepID=A0AAF0QFE5_SOLVR|nr:hypothetical protein MTR67_012274 [Solanum verrucosum]
MFTAQKILQYVFNQKDFNLRQRRCLELLKDCDFLSVLYHPDKANVVADTLSQLSMGSVSDVEEDKKELVRDVHRLSRLGVQLMDSTKGGVMVHNGSESSFVNDVKAKQCLDLTLVELKEVVLKKSVEAFSQKEMVYLDIKVATKMFCDIWEALYNRRCRSSTGWFDMGEVALIGPDLVYESIDKVQLIRERLRTTQSRQKSCADVRRKDLEFDVIDWVYLKIPPMKVLMCFGKKGKLSPRYVGPYQILIRVGLRVDESLSYEEVPIEILDREVKKFRKKEVVSVKVLWRNHSVEDPKKKDTVKSWPGPLSPSHIRSFLGLARYYRRHYLYGVHIDMFTAQKILQYVFNQKDFNLRQRRCLELLKDCDFLSVLYHPDKANVVADTLSQLSMGSVSDVEEDKKELVRDVHRLSRLGVQLMDSTKGGVMVHNGSESSFVNDVKAKQCLDLTLVELKEVVLKKSVEAFSQKEMVYLDIKVATKMFCDIWEVYWWNGMMNDIAGFVA